MRQNQAQRHRTGRLSGKGASDYRVSSRRPRRRRAASASPRPGRPARRRKVVNRDRRNRRPLLFYVLVASVSAQIASAFAGMGALVALFTLTGLLLSAMAIYAEG